MLLLKKKKPCQSFLLLFYFPVGCHSAQISVQLHTELTQGMICIKTEGWAFGEEKKMEC